jgi:hypothetical protein
VRANWISLRLVPALLAVLLSTHCDDPKAPPAEGDHAFTGQFDAGNHVMEFQLGTNAGNLRLVVSNLEMNPNDSTVHAWVAIRNDGVNSVPGPAGVTVGHFVPNEVAPLNAACLGGCPTINCAPCVFDHRDTYGEDGVLQAGEMSAPIEWILRNPSGESFAFRAWIDAGEPDGAIGGCVFRDANANGRRESTEPGIPSIAVTLFDPNGLMTIAHTDADGRFTFAITAPGLYQVVRACPPCLEPPFPCRLTTPDRYEVLIIRRNDGTLSSFLHADFGCAGDVRPDSASVEGVVFDDANRNGSLDRGERGIPGVRIRALSLACPDRGAVETLTDDHGHYALLLSECGPPWMVERQDLPGFTGTTPNPVRIGGPNSDPTVPPVPGDPGHYRVDFGMTNQGDPFPRYGIDGTVFLDANENGMRDRGEAGIGGVGVSASSLACALPVLAYTETARDGSYRLDGAQVSCPLPWGVQAYLERHRPTTPLPVVLDAPPADGVAYHVDFGFAPTTDSLPPGVTVHGSVYFDLDLDGIRDRGEPGIPGVALTLLTPLDIIITAHTGPDGQYRFPPYPIVFGVHQSLPEFPQRTTPNPVNFEPDNRPERIADFGIAAGLGRP